MAAVQQMPGPVGVHGARTSGNGSPASQSRGLVSECSSCQMLGSSALGRPLVKSLRNFLDEFLYILMFAVCELNASSFLEWSA
jgi:hypothetical protein